MFDPGCKTFLPLTKRFLSLKLKCSANLQNYERKYVKTFLIFQIVILNFLLFFSLTEVKLSNELTTHLCEEVLDLKKRFNDTGVVANNPSTPEETETNSKWPKIAAWCLFTCCVIGVTVLYRNIIGSLLHLDTTQMQNLIESHVLSEKKIFETTHVLINGVSNEIKNDNSKHYAQIIVWLKVHVDLAPKKFTGSIGKGTLKGFKPP